MKEFLRSHTAKVHYGQHNEVTLSRHAQTPSNQDLCPTEEHKFNIRGTHFSADTVCFEVLN